MFGKVWDEIEGGCYLPRFLRFCDAVNVGVCAICEDCKYYKKEELIMKSLKNEDWFCCWTNELERDAMIKALIDKGFDALADSSAFDCLAPGREFDFVAWDSYAAEKNGYHKISVSTFWKRLAIKDDLPDELPPIKTNDALKACASCPDAKRILKILWPEIL